MSQSKHLLVGVPTFRRPTELARLLRSLSKVKIPRDFNLYLVIAENGVSEKETANVVEHFRKDPKPFESIKFLGVPERGISYVRNAILQYAFIDNKFSMLAMVDDDETVTTQWLVELVNTQTKYNSSCVGGRKIPEFENSPSEWMTASHIYSYEPVSNESECSRLVSTDNLLIDGDSFLTLGSPLFDPDFGLTGGGDTEYLHRVKKLGAKFAFSSEAVTIEHVPSSRMQWSWAKKRAYRIGIGIARINIKHNSTWLENARFCVRALGISVVSAMLFVLCFWSANKRKLFALFFIQQLGKYAGLFGKQVFPYASNSS